MWKGETVCSCGHFVIVWRLTSSGATGSTSVLSKTSISSPSALAATAGEELTGVSRVPPVILGLPFSIQPRRAAPLSSGTTPHTLQSNFAPRVRQQRRRAGELRIAPRFGCLS